MQPDHPGQDPYGQQQPYPDPTASTPDNPYAPSSANPYAPPPANPYSQPADPYTDPADPYAQPADPYAQPPNPHSQVTDPPVSPTAPYGQPPASGQPYAQPPASGAPYDPYGQPAYGQPAGYGQPYADPYAAQPYGGAPMYPNAGFAGSAGQDNTLGLVSMILGIASIPLACCYLGIPLGVAAGVTGWMGKQKADKGLANNSGQALAGMICGAIGAVLGLFQIILVVLGFIADS